MTTTAGSSEQIEAYLAAVRASLGDIAEDERADLLAEVEASLIEAVGDIESPFAALGPPEAFAAELRASAGLGEPTAFDGPSPSAIDAARVFIADLRRRPWVAKALPTARELAPIWWVARGYLAVVAVVVATGTWWSDSRPWLPDISTPRTGALVILAATAASVAFGVLRRRHLASWLLVAVVVNVAALLAIVPALRHVTNAPASTPIVIEQGPVAATPAFTGITYGGRKVLNIYPYSREGKLLHDVQLFDDLGRPLFLDLGADQLRRVPKTAKGLGVLNAFPIRYRQPGTRVVAHPDAAPRARAPRLVTPALRG
jgi:hypothetical protein